MLRECCRVCVGLGGSYVENNLFLYEIVLFSGRGSKLFERLRVLDIRYNLHWWTFHRLTLSILLMRPKGRNM